jgi:two-component system copper resistance phosphate regulon response regulator CusR
MRSQWETLEVVSEEPLTSFDDGTLRIDFVQQKVTIDRTPVNLKPPEFRLLTALALRRGEIFTPEKLMELFADDSKFTPEGVAYALMCLRTKLGRKEDDELIQTVRGFGYVYRSPNQGPS